MTPSTDSPPLPMEPFRQSAARVALPFFLSRLWVALFAYLAHSQRPFLAPVEGGWVGVPNWWLNPWTTYDSLWFVMIGQGGYQDTYSTVFFPLYPLLLRLVGTNEVAMAAWGVLLSNTLFFLALVLLYRLALRAGDATLASLTVWLLAFCPTTVFFSAVYTESLFLFLIVLAFDYAQRRGWGWAGFFGGLAALTRNSGVVIGLALALAYLETIRYDWRGLRWRPLLSLSLPVLAFVGVQLFLASSFGSPLMSLNNQTSFHRAWSWPWLPLLQDIALLLKLHGVNPESGFTIFVTGLVFFGTLVVNLFATLLAFALVGRYGRRFPIAYSVLILAVLGMHLGYARFIPPHTIGSARYLSTTFPFTLFLAFALRDLSAHPRLRLFLALLIAWTSAIVAYLFGLKLFLG